MRDISERRRREKEMRQAKPSPYLQRLEAQRAAQEISLRARAARFQPDHTAGNAAEERQHLPAPQSLTQNRRTLRINAVNLKNMLGYVQPDRRSLAHGCLLFIEIRRNSSFVC